MADNPKTDAPAMLKQAGELLRRGRLLEARSVLEGYYAHRPWTPDARTTLAEVLSRLGQSDRAEAELRSGLKSDKGHEGLTVALADMMLASARMEEAEKVLRVALRVNRRAPRVATRLADLLGADRRPAEALQVTAPLVVGGTSDHAVLARHAKTLKALGRITDALMVYERAADLHASSVIAQHNLASSLGDHAQFARAEATSLRALSLGGDAPQTWLVYARSLLGQNKLDEADGAFRQAIKRQPDYVEAHRDLAQLIWMRTENVALATTMLDEAIQRHPQAHGLSELKATCLEYAGDLGAAYRTLVSALTRTPEVVALQMSAAHLASLAGDPHAGLAHAQLAAAMAPEAGAAQMVLAELCLAIGDAGRAAAITERLLAQNPYDQAALAYRGTAWRLLGDARYRSPLEDDGSISVSQIDTPDGWDDLDAYLTDLALTLIGLHAFRTHPLDQSLRHGSQASDLKRSDDPVIQAFFQAVDGPIQRHLAAMGTGVGPVKSRNSGGYEIMGAWSVLLRPGGFHTDHLHPQGWLSSACYIALPKAVKDTSAREGWLKFGQPGIATTPRLAAERWVAPGPGLLAMFPSHIWHGTEPFAGDEKRLSIAFDIVPAA